MFQITFSVLCFLLLKIFSDFELQGVPDNILSVMLSLAENFLGFLSYRVFEITFSLLCFLLQKIFSDFELQDVPDNILIIMLYLAENFLRF